MTQEEKLTFDEYGTAYQCCGNCENIRQAAFKLMCRKSKDELLKANEQLIESQKKLSEVAKPENEPGSFVPEFIDLGLPSGRLWADRNAGARKPAGELIQPTTTVGSAGSPSGQCSNLSFSSLSCLNAPQRVKARKCLIEN